MSIPIFAIKIQTCTSRQMMKQLLAGVGALALLSSFSLVHAQAPPPVIRFAAPFSYDISLEVALNGTISAIVPKPSAEMIAGTHLLLTTLSGSVDVSLGTFALLGKNPLFVTPGQQVEVVGVMKTLKDREVFLARAVKVGDRTYAIRNEHGIPISPQARERAIQKTAQSGERR